MTDIHANLFLHSHNLPGRTLGHPGGTTEAGRAAIGLCETQPIAVAGIRAVLGDAADLQLAWACNSVPTCLQLARTSPPAVMILDKSFGTQVIIDAIADVRTAGLPVAVVVWGMAMSESEALRFLQAGARGILPKTSDLSTLLTCVRRVAGGGNWMEEYVIRNYGQVGRTPRTDLTRREQQVLELVEQGLKNKEIADSLAIRPGTVKIHLKHIFEKTGVRGRYGLALASLRDRPARPASRQPEAYPPSF